MDETESDVSVPVESLPELLCSYDFVFSVVSVASIFASILAVTPNSSTSSPAVILELKLSEYLFAQLRVVFQLSVCDTDSEMVLATVFATLFSTLIVLLKVHFKGSPAPLSFVLIVESMIFSIVPRS